MAMAKTVASVATNETEIRNRRREAMSVLACASSAEIESRMASIENIPAHEEIRVPESGLVMLRGRIGGDGAPFNLGEAAVSRAAVKLATGEAGIGYVLGRDRTKAKLIALCDALVQSDDHREAVERLVLAPIRNRLKTERELQERQTAATKVEFFTLVRGEG
jgi:alpha-D-ribose 1-methylphosphonate 5-triphosphate synthase subunit PhnG